MVLFLLHLSYLCFFFVWEVAAWLKVLPISHWECWTRSWANSAECRTCILAKKQQKNVSVNESSEESFCFTKLGFSWKFGLDNFDPRPFLSFALGSFVDASGTFAHGISKLDPSLLHKLSFFSFFVESHFLTPFFILTIHCHLYIPTTT